MTFAYFPFHDSSLQRMWPPVHLNLVWCDNPFKGLIYVPFTWAPESGLANPARKWFVYDTLMSYPCCNIYILADSNVSTVWHASSSTLRKKVLHSHNIFVQECDFWDPTIALITTTLHLTGDVTANECQLMHTILSQIICSCTYYRTYMVCRSSLCSQEASLMTNAVYGVMLNYSSFRMAIPAYTLLHAKGTLLLWRIYWSMAPRSPEFRYVNQCN